LSLDWEFTQRRFVGQRRPPETILDLLWLREWGQKRGVQKQVLRTMVRPGAPQGEEEREFED